MQIIQCFKFFPLLFFIKISHEKASYFLFTISKKKTEKDFFLWLMIFLLFKATFVLTVEEDREKQTENIALKMIGERGRVGGESSIFFYVDQK